MHSTERNEELLGVFERQGETTLKDESTLPVRVKSAVYCPPEAEHNVTHTGVGVLRSVDVVSNARKGYWLGVGTFASLFLRTINTSDANSIAGSQIHRSSLWRMANPRGLKKRVTAIGETRIGLHARK
jgi:hypothetical protein